VNPKWKLKKTLATAEKPAREPCYVRDKEGEDPEYLGWVRSLPCAVKAYPFPGSTPCRGPIEAHHPTGAGLALKAPDRDAFALCNRHHGEFHGNCGTFKGWLKSRLRDWQRRTTRLHQALYVLKHAPTGKE